MFKRQFAATLMALLLIPAMSQAQFGNMPSLGKGNAAAPAGGDPVGQQDALVKGFVSANKDVALANAAMLDAVGKKDEAGKARATADQLTEGATKGNLEEADRANSATSTAVAEQLRQAPKLDGEAKKTFAAGMLVLASGVKKYMGLSQGLQDMSKSLSSASPMMLPKLQSAVYLVKAAPSSIKAAGDALRNAVAFAKSNDIPVPKDVASLI